MNQPRGEDAAGEPPGGPSDPDRSAGPGPGGRYAWAARAAAMAWPVLGALVLPAKYGFDHADPAGALLTLVEILLALGFGLRTLKDYLARRDARVFLRDRAGEAVSLALLLTALLFLWIAEGWTLGWRHFVFAVEIFLALNVLLALVRLERVLLNLSIRPVRIFVLSFAGLILAGTAFLYFLPRATHDPGGLSLVDSLFTATSATCVTGLIVVDTGTAFTRLGQSILIILIQLGGLGIMTFAAFIGLAMGKGLGLRERAVMKRSLNLEFIGDMGRLVLFILLVTFGLEAAGAVASLLIGVGAEHPEGPVWFAVFHAVSAFCNAGFCLNADSYEPYAGGWAFLSVQMALIVLGGLGFAVLRDVQSLKALVPAPLRRLPVLRTFFPPGASPRLSVHTRIVLVSSAVLLLAGAAAFFLLERDGLLAGRGGSDALLASLFQSVTARTAGFNTVAVGALATPTLLVLMFLMFIGASPGSTGGGIKTTTFSVMVLEVGRMFRGRRDVELRGRRIPREVLRRAMGLAFIATTLVGSFTLVLGILEPGFDLRQILFEVVSAFGTVGLSTGITPDLSTGGKLLVTAAMFVGRLGPITLVWAMQTERSLTRLYTYPEGRVMIG